MRHDAQVLYGMQNVIVWPNGLGCDVQDAEVWFHRDKFRVFDGERAMLVPYAVTRNVETAVAICRERGLTYEYLNGLEFWQAQAEFAANLPKQRELY